MNCKNKPPGVDYLRYKLLKPIVSIIAPTIAHTINVFCGKYMFASMENM